MGERKSEAINLRMAPSTKELLRRVAESEHRTLSNMLEVLIRERAEKCGLEGQSTASGPVRTKKR
ncbi:DUF1778 domain-containing protein [Methylibium sp. T29]|uniref:type II toxin -antitoxin system TacA 1-like antitoxin n=1 Tax=Methylibium sp. T29 TaxID=1430884 RepID=UPI0003F3F614|nr:hypothetical protein X551_04456 [Methylibium sp. T29]